MSEMRPNETYANGHYAKKRIFGEDPLISWAHGHQFQTGLRLARSFAGLRLLNSGRGDGTLLAGNPSHDHEVLSWLRLEDRRPERFAAEKKESSPPPWVPPGLGSQVWFVDRRRD